MVQVDLSFPIRGDTVPFDHGYALYGALTRALPSLHGANWLAVHPIGGRRAEDVLLLGRRAELRLRLDAGRIAEVLPLAGRELSVGPSLVQLGAPSVWPLRATPQLDARMVSVKLTEVPRRASSEHGRDVLDTTAFADAFSRELARQLATLGIQRPFQLTGRRRMSIAGRQIVGFSVRVVDLDEQQSLALMTMGVGGRRRMGCGVFRATRDGSRG